MFSGYHMEEAYDDLLFGERPQEGDIYTPYNKICRYCGQGNLRWGETEEGWRLFTFELKRHTCDSWGRQTAATRSKARGI